MTKALIIEDELPAATRLTKLIHEADSEIEIIETLDSVESAIKWFKNNQHPDLLFLDIQLGDGLSFEIFNHVNVESFVIFTTAYDEYAIKAFELNSIDYLLKPIDSEKLKYSIEKFNRLKSRSEPININSIIDTIQLSKKEFKKRFVVNIGSKLKSIETSDIVYFYVMEKGAYFFTNDGRNYPIDFSLDKLESLLNPDDFFRINRQAIINYKYINKISIFSKSRIKLETLPANEVELLVSSNKSHHFRLWLDK